MSCSKTTDKCFQSDCGCINRVDTECITYDGESLPNTNIPTGTNFNTFLKSIDTFFGSVINLINSLIIKNIGTGQGVFKQINNIGEREFKSLKSLNTSLQITSTEEEIDFNVSPATTTEKGIIEIATQLEVDTGTDTERAITPATNKQFTETTVINYVSNPLNLPKSSETQLGVIEIATETETNAGTDNERAITPLKLKTYVDNPANIPFATEIQRGISEIATQVEVDTGIDDEKIVTPLKLRNLISDPINLPSATTTEKGIIEIATDIETQTGTDNERAITPANLSSRTATETRTGILEIATQVEANALIVDDKIITPAKLPIASDTQLGLSERATQLEVTTGTDNERFVTPLTLQTKLDSLSLGLQVTSVNINTWSTASAITINHNISSPPITVFLKAVCQIAEGGYVAGETITITTSGHSYEDNGSGDDGGITFTLNGTLTSNMAIGDRVAAMQKTGGNNFFLSSGNWDFIVSFLHT